MILVWLVVVALWLVGLAGIVFPVLPGIGLVFAGILVYAIFDQFSAISPLTVFIFGAITLASYALSYLGAAYGAKKAGSSLEAIIGAGLLALLGLATSGPIGLLLGAFLGIFLGALFQGKDKVQASKEALISLVGVISGILVQLVLAIAMIFAFLVIVLF